jgi:hypothetical protein
MEWPAVDDELLPAIEDLKSEHPGVDRGTCRLGAARARSAFQGESVTPERRAGTVRA